MRYQRKLLKAEIFSQQEIDFLNQELERQAQQAYENALKSPWPEANSLLEHVY